MGFKVMRKDHWNSVPIPLFTHTLDKEGKQKPLSEEQANEYAKAYQASDSSCQVIVEKS